jgi:hypothetical protein
MIRYCFTTPQPSAGDFSGRSLVVWVQGKGICSSVAQGAAQGQAQGNSQGNRQSAQAGGLLSQAVFLSCKSGLRFAKLPIAKLPIYLPNNLRVELQGQARGRLHQLDDVLVRGQSVNDAAVKGSSNGLEHRTDRPEQPTEQLFAQPIAQFMWGKPISAGLEQRHRSGRYRCKNGTVPQQD